MDEILNVIDKGYFNIIIASNTDDITLQSKNTGHYWYFHFTGVSGDRAYIVYHKHKFSHPYHQHCYCNSLKQVISSIQSHDLWVLRGRKR